MTSQSNSGQGRGHDRLLNWNPKNGGMLISQPISSCLTNHSELCMSHLLNNQPHRISIYRLQWRPSFGFESSVSSTPMTSGDPVLLPNYFDHLLSSSLLLLFSCHNSFICMPSRSNESRSDADLVHGHISGGRECSRRRRWQRRRRCRRQETRWTHRARPPRAADDTRLLPR